MSNPHNSKRPGSVIEKLGDLMWVVNFEEFIFFHGRVLMPSRKLNQMTFGEVVKNIKERNFRICVDNNQRSVRTLNNVNRKRKQKQL